MQHVQPLLVKFMDTARKVLDSDEVTLFLHDPSTKELWTCVIKDDAVREIRIPSHEGLAGAVFQSGETLNIEDVQNYPRHRRDIADKSGYVCNTMLVEPLINKTGQRIGVIQAINKRGNASFSQADEAQMRQFAAQVVDTLENASKWKSLLPGLAMVVGVAAIASGLHWMLPAAAGKAIGVVLIAIVLGLSVRNVFTLPVNWEPGIRFAVHHTSRGCARSPRRWMVRAQDGLAAEIKKRGEALGPAATWRNANETVPQPASLAPATSGGVPDANVLVDDYWDVYKVLLR